MREFFVAFRSRSEAIKYLEILQSYKIASKIINTPQKAGIGCGLSVKLFSKDMSRAMTVLQRNRFTSMINMYYISPYGDISRI